MMAKRCSLPSPRECYEMLAGLKINFNKSEIIMINDEENLGQIYVDLFNCRVGLFLSNT